MPLRVVQQLARSGARRAVRTCHRTPGPAGRPGERASRARRLESPRPAHHGCERRVVHRRPGGGIVSLDDPSVGVSCAPGRHAGRSQPNHRTPLATRSGAAHARYTRRPELHDSGSDVGRRDIAPRRGNSAAAYDPRYPATDRAHAGSAARPDLGRGVRSGERLLARRNHGHACRPRWRIAVAESDVGRDTRRAGARRGCRCAGRAGRRRRDDDTVGPQHPGRRTADLLRIASIERLESDSGRDRERAGSPVGAGRPGSRPTRPRPAALRAVRESRGADRHRAELSAGVERRIRAESTVRDRLSRAGKTQLETEPARSGRRRTHGPPCVR